MVSRRETATRSVQPIEAGYWHACGVRTDGTLACWGRTIGTTPGDKFKSVSAGIEHTCAIRADDTAACWGKPDYGRTDAPDGAFLSISAGGGRSCGLLSDLSIDCWGTPLGRSSPNSSDRNYSASGGGRAGIPMSW